MRLRAKSRDCVGGILAPGDAALAQDTAPRRRGRLSSSGRTIAVVGDRPDAGQTGGPGAAQESEQHSLRLIGAGVAERDAIHFARGEQAAEKIVAGAAGGLLQVVPGLGRQVGNVTLGKVHRQTQCRAEVVYKSGILT